MPGTVGFIGLGLLGTPVARNLLRAGHRVLVHNRTQAKADPLIQEGAEWAARPADAVTAGGVVITLLWDDEAAEEVLLSEGFLSALGDDGIHISMTTISPACARRLAALHEKHGSHLVAAPVFGVPAAAEARKLLLPISGAGSAKNRVRPILEAAGADRVHDFGEDVGAAYSVKIAGNFLIISAAEAMSQALGMLRQQGLALRPVVDLLTNELFPIPVYQRNGNALAEGRNPMRQTRIPDKDLKLFVDAVGSDLAGIEIAQAIQRMRAS